MERATTTIKIGPESQTQRLTDAIGQMQEAKSNQWERCGCIVKCGRLKRRSEAKLQESPAIVGKEIDTSRPPRRRYSKDNDRHDMMDSQCRLVRCEGTQSPMKFISPKMPREANNKQSAMASYGGIHSG